MAASTRFSYIVPHHWFLELIPVKPAPFCPSVYCLDYRTLNSPLDSIYWSFILHICHFWSFSSTAVWVTTATWRTLVANFCFHLSFNSSAAQALNCSTQLGTPIPPHSPAGILLAQGNRRTHFSTPRVGLTTHQSVSLICSPRKTPLL